MEQLKSRLDEVLNSKSEVKFINEFKPEGVSQNIKAFTIEGEEYQGRKTKVFGYYGLPNNTDKKIPAVVLVHGGGGHAYCCWVKEWNDRGYAAVAIDTTGYMPKNKNAGYREGLDDDNNWERQLNGVFEEKDYICPPDNDQMDIDDKELQSQWMFHAVSSLIKINSFLREQPEIDRDKIGVVGISWGGVITSILLGYDTRFAFGIPIYGSGYLAEGVSYISEFFRNSQVENLWLAEKNFNKFKMPVLWLAWNDDSCFTVNSNSKSFEDTVKNNGKTRISLINNMKHSHQCAWARKESFYFANSVIGKVPDMPQIINNSSLPQINIEIKFDEKIKIKSAMLYYQKSHKYKNFDKYGEGERSYFAENWNRVPLAIECKKVTEVFTEKIAGYYIEVIYIYGEKEYVVTTPYKSFEPFLYKNEINI